MTGQLGSWKSRRMHGFTGRTKPAPRTPSQERGGELCRALTVWCKHRARVSEAPAFLSQSGHTRAAEMAAALLSMPPRSTGTADFPSGVEEKGRQPRPENGSKPGTCVPHTDLTTTIKCHCAPGCCQVLYCLALPLSHLYPTQWPFKIPITSKGKMTQVKVNTETSNPDSRSFQFKKHTYVHTHTHKAFLLPQ